VCSETDAQGEALDGAARCDTMEAFALETPVKVLFSHFLGNFPRNFREYLLNFRVCLAIG